MTESTRGDYGDKLSGTSARGRTTWTGRPAGRSHTPAMRSVSSVSTAWPDVVVLRGRPCVGDV